MNKHLNLNKPAKPAQAKPVTLTPEQLHERIIALASNKRIEVAQAIIDTLKIEPDYDVDETRGWWPYKDWQDLRDRVENEFDVEIGQEASEYLSFAPEANSVFRMKITGESMGMKREVNCECYVKDKKVRYIKWQED